MVEAVKTEAVAVKKEDKQAPTTAEAASKDAAESKAKVVAESTERVANAKPTPTQAENDAAAAGFHVDEKEPDGSPPQGMTAKETEELKKKQAEAKPGGAPYQTRAATPKS